MTLNGPMGDQVHTSSPGRGRSTMIRGDLYEPPFLWTPPCWKFFNLIIQIHKVKAAAPVARGEGGGGGGEGKEGREGGGREGGRAETNMSSFRGDQFYRDRPYTH